MLHRLLLLLFLTSVPFFVHWPSSSFSSSPIEVEFVRFFCRLFVPIPFVLSLLCPTNLCSLAAKKSIFFVDGTQIYRHNQSHRLQLLRSNTNNLPLSSSYSNVFFHREEATNAKHQKASKEKECRSCQEKWSNLTSKERQNRQMGRRKAGQSEERGRRPTKDKQNVPLIEMPMPMTFTPSPPVWTTTMGSWTRTTMPNKHHYWSSTIKLVAEDRRHRSASESVENGAERHGKKLNGRPSSKGDSDSQQRRASISNNKIRKGATAATKPHQQKRGRGGTKAASNWRGELSSTEQSIAMMSRCQEADTRELLPSATTCRNLRSDKVCNYLFQAIETKTGRRDVKCNLQGLEDIAESCRKTCGICCEDINYACEDDQNGIVDCSRQLDKCHHKKWFGVLSRFCAGSCGLCAMSACRDYDNSCRVRKSLCLKQESLDYMRENCARTCGFCVIGEESSAASIGAGNEREAKGDHEQQRRGTKANSGKPVVVGRPPKGKHRLVLPECTDKVDNCTANAHLCSSPNLGEYMIKFCTKTCLKCGETQTKPMPGGPPPIELIIEPMMETNNQNKESGRNRNGNNGIANRKTRKCEDREERCVQWKLEGLCGDAKNRTSFNDGQRRACAKTCGDCQ